ncbi:PIN domain-containing protein [Kamptonema animale CS-326]|jgi:hypothetical protein|uniref:PIN domain-containing protein n=1 Tax=Kamptonema animale TaxID=92934 RepID=UPI00232F5081|nr:PIN domain-containing protein [Kamptonema animale]MDB9514765.1 PIN domain-containing protein [Kamptonema animale CS-326]
MRNLFSWRLQPSEKDLTNLWETAIFVFDTNFLCDLYRVSHSTAKDYLNILDHLQSRIWLPYQVASEFLNNREGIIDSEAKSFKKALSDIKQWKDAELKFDRLKGLIAQTGRIVKTEVAFLFDQQDAYTAAIEEVEKCFKDKIEEIAKTHSVLNSEEDYILEKLFTLFDGKVGEPYSIETLQKLYKEGEERYKQKKPPGFEDKGKADEGQYGDFILWKQILEFAKEKSSSIVFVTDDKKKDWWTNNKKKGEIASPHFELRREFKEQVNQPFWMYQTQDFLAIAKDKLEIDISPRSIEEANIVAKAEAAEEQSYEEFSEVLRQIQIPRIGEAAFQALSTARISEAAIKALGTAIASENLLPTLSTSRIYEATIKALGTAIASENLLQALSTPRIHEAAIKAFGTAIASENLLQALSTPRISEDVLSENHDKLVSEQNDS